MAEKTKLEKCKEKCDKKCRYSKKCRETCKEKCKEKKKKDIGITQSQNVVVNVRTGRSKSSKKARTAAPKAQPYDFLKNELNQYQTAMANQLNALEQSRYKYMEERDKAEGVQRALFQNELMNVNRRMNQVFDNLNDRGINVGAIIREGVESQPPMGIPVGDTPPFTTLQPPPEGIPVSGFSGFAGFPGNFPSTSMQSQESRVAQLESTGSIQPPRSIISSGEFESDPAFIPEMTRQGELARRDEQARLEREGLAQQTRETFERMMEDVERFKGQLGSPPGSLTQRQIEKLEQDIATGRIKMIIPK